MPRSASEETGLMLRRRFEWLSGFNDNELGRISVCEEGETLKGGEEYFDVSQPERGVIQGRQGERVPEGSCYVAKGDVSASIWQKLTTPLSGGTGLRM